MLKFIWLVAAVSLGQGRANPSPCPIIGGGQAGRGSAEVCLGEEELRSAAALPKTSPDRLKRFHDAVEHLRRGANETSDAELKAAAFDDLATLFDKDHLNLPGE